MSLEFSNLSPSEMLTLYMDGELPEAMQPSLFTMLSQQADLRQEMQDQFTMRKFIDNTMIMPPDTMHESIMRRIGAVAIGATLNNPVSTGMMQSASAWFGKAVQPLMYLLIGASVSGLYFASKQQTPVIDQASTVQQTSSMPQKMQSSVNQPMQNIMQQRMAIPSLQQSSSAIIPQQAVLPFSNQASVQQPMQQVVTTQENVQQVPIEQIAVQTSDIDQSLKPMPLESTSKIDNSDQAISPFSLTMRGFTQHSFVDQTVTPVNNPFINSLSVGLHYDLTDKDAVYLEVGQESIAQRYTGTENNYTVQYNQTYLAPWAMMGWQHRFAKHQQLRPLIRVGAGGMSTGPMARMTLGMEYDISKSITLIGGIEGMSTLYSYQGQWFSTQKAGITYGARVSLR